MKIAAHSSAEPVEPHPARPKSRMGFWLKRIALWLILGIISLATLGAVYQTIATAMDQRFETLTDRRQAKGKRYALATIVVGMFLAKLCGEDKPSGIAEWVALRGSWIAWILDLKRKSMPSHHTYRRALAEIDEEEFERLAREYCCHCGEAGYQVVISLDGKILRGTIDLDVSDALHTQRQVSIPNWQGRR